MNFFIYRNNKKILKLMRHLESFQNYNLQSINEEEGLLKTAMLSAGLLFSNIEAYPQQVGVKTEIVAESPSLEVNFLEASTSKTKCPNSALHKFGLTKQNSKFYTSTVADFKSKIGGDSSQILKNFKPTNLDIQGEDVLKIGESTLIDNGSKVFSLEDGTQIIVASANGLLALTRAARAGESLPYSMVKISFKTPERNAKSVSYDLGDRIDLTGSCNTLYFAFQTAINPSSKFDSTSIGNTSLNKLIGASEDFQVEYITSFCNNVLKKFVPKEMQESVFSQVQFTKFDSTIVRDFLRECKKKGSVDMSSFGQKILTPYKKFYLENFKIFTDTYFPKEVSKKMQAEYSNKLITKTKTAGVNAWVASSTIPVKQTASTYKAPEFKYAQGK